MAGMFIQMTLTNWVSPTDNITADDTNTYTFWIKTSTTLIIITGMVHLFQDFMIFLPSLSNLNLNSSDFRA